MADRRFGEPVNIDFAKETTVQTRKKPALEWEIGEDTRRRLEQLEENSRLAEHRLGLLLRT